MTALTDHPPGKPAYSNGASQPLRGALIAHVDVRVEAFVGAASMTVAELAALQTGAAIELDAALNTPVELRVNGLAVARGELVAIGDKFGVRIVEIAT